MPPKGKGGKSKAGEAPASGGEVKAFQTRSSKAGLQVCLSVLASERSSVAAGASADRVLVGGVAPIIVPRRPYPPISQTAHSEQYAYRR